MVQIDILRWLCGVSSQRKEQFRTTTCISDLGFRMMKCSLVQTQPDCSCYTQTHWFGASTIKPECMWARVCVCVHVMLWNCWWYLCLCILSCDFLWARRADVAESTALHLRAERMRGDLQPPCSLSSRLCRAEFTGESCDILMHAAEGFSALRVQMTRQGCWLVF